MSSTLEKDFPGTSVRSEEAGSSGLDLLALSRLMHVEGIGKSAMLCFWTLWVICGHEPGIIKKTTAHELGKYFPRGQAIKWLKELEEAGLIEVERYKAGMKDADLQRHGDLRVHVFYPNTAPISEEEKRERRRNLDQKLFPFMEERLPEPAQESIETVKPSTPKVSEKSVEKPISKPVEKPAIQKTGKGIDFSRFTSLFGDATPEPKNEKLEASEALASSNIPAKTEKPVEKPISRHPAPKPLISLPSDEDIAQTSRMENDLIEKLGLEDDTDRYTVYMLVMIYGKKVFGITTYNKIRDGTLQADNPSAYIEKCLNGEIGANELEKYRLAAKGRVRSEDNMRN